MMMMMMMKQFLLNMGPLNKWFVQYLRKKTNNLDR